MESFKKNVLVPGLIWTAFSFWKSAAHTGLQKLEISCQKSFYISKQRISATYGECKRIAQPTKSIKMIGRAVDRLIKMCKKYGAYI